MDEYRIKKAAESLIKEEGASISEATLERLAAVPSEPLPTTSNLAWEVSARYRGRDDIFRIAMVVVMAGKPEAAKAKAALLGNFPESSIRSVYQIDGIARFAHIAAELVGSARYSSGCYEVDETLLRQARVLAVLVRQQLV